MHEGLYYKLGKPLSQLLSACHTCVYMECKLMHAVKRRSNCFRLINKTSGSIQRTILLRYFFIPHSKALIYNLAFIISCEGRPWEQGCI